LLVLAKKISNFKGKTRRIIRNRILVFVVSISLIWGIISYQVTAQTNYQHIHTLRAPKTVTEGGFGTSVAIDGDLIVVGEILGTANSVTKAGKVYIFNTTGHLLVNLTASNPQKNANFGWAVDISGDKVVVGEPLANVNGEADAGRAHIFSTAGVHLKTLTAPTPIEGVEFGTSVAIDENLIIIGTYVRIGGFPKATDLRPSPVGTKSLVYLYDTEGNLQNTLESPVSTDPSSFGVSSAIDGEIIVIGEDHSNVSGVPDAGRAYIFSTNGTPLATLEPSTPTWWGVFGLTVAVCGDVVVISEPWSDPGNIHIFDSAGNKIKTLSGNYGPGIAVGSNIIVAGADDPVGNKRGAGRACIYDLNGNFLQNLTSPNPQESAHFAAWGHFGSRVLALDEGTLVVGVPLEDINPNGDVGRVYTFSESLVHKTSTSEDSTPGFQQTSFILGIFVSTLIVVKKRR
jgi:hypothetical protein